MDAWLMIIIIHGWSGGIGSQGNVIHTVEYIGERAEEKCNDARNKLNVEIERHVYKDSHEIVCTPK